MEALNRVGDDRDGLIEDRALAEAVKGFQQWRATRTKRYEKIPEALWQAATALYPRYNINRIARALRLDYVDVRDRIHPKGKGGGRQQHKGAVRAGSKNEGVHFLELPRAATGAVGECSMKVREGLLGKRIDIRVKGAGVGQLLETLRGLWGVAQ